MIREHLDEKAADLGVLVAAAFMRLLSKLVPKDMAARMPFLDGVSLNMHTEVFACAVARGAALLLAGTSMARLSFQKVRDGLTAGDRGGGKQVMAEARSQSGSIELAVVVVLMAGAGLLGKSFYRLLHVPLGFYPNRVATARVIAPEHAYKGGNATDGGISREIVERVKSLPGVESVGMTTLFWCNAIARLIGPIFRRGRITENTTRWTSGT